MLRRLWEQWKVVAHVIGNVQSRLLLCLFYFLVLAPFALGVRLFADPLRLQKPSRSAWLPKPTERLDRWAKARRQF
jgi:Saxitoxin biosynthesis operon protein SxtJ